MDIGVNTDEDPYQSEGHIELKIEKISEFAKSGFEDRRLSDAVYIRGLPWRILVKHPRRGSLGFFLLCDADNKDPSWSCSVSAILKILPQKDEIESCEVKISPKFHAKQKDSGYTDYITFEGLMDPKRGWYNQEEDSIILAADVVADVPQGVTMDIDTVGWKRGTIEFELPDANVDILMSTVKKIRGFEWQVLPPEWWSADHLVIACNQECKQQLWFCEAKIQVRVKKTSAGGWKNVGGPAVKHCFNSFDKFDIRFRQHGEGMPANIAVDIEVMWSAINLPKLDANLTVNYYDGQSEVIPVNRSFLANYSRYFNNLFFGDWNEKKKGSSSTSAEADNLREINENDAHFDVTAFTFMINAMHVMGPMLPKMLPFPWWGGEDHQTKVALLKYAVKYGLPVCAKFAEDALIARRSTCTELLELLEVADEIGLNGLKLHCLLNVKAGEYCSENFGQNCDIRARLSKKTREELDARLEATAEQQPPTVLDADVPCCDLKRTG